MEKWMLYTKRADFAALAEKFQISPMLARMIRNRDVCSEEEIEKYLHGTTKDLYDPFLLKGMEEAVALTRGIIQNQGKIRIIGDYDVDGVCSSYILKTFLNACGAEVDIRLPHRMKEGYGMNEAMADEAQKDDIQLIITCDNGISANKAVQRARDLGIFVIVTDHHEPPKELPCADVIIDAKQEDCPYPFKELCGGGVAYKFACAFQKAYQLPLGDLLEELLPFAGIATVADIVPLQDENRILASEGIRRLRHTENIGLNALMQLRGIDKSQVNAGQIGFVIGPCINSAGRLSDATLAVKLLEEKDPVQAEHLAQELSDLNEERKSLTLEQSELALKELEQRGLDKILVVYLPNAHESVAGIVAGRIKDVYHRPGIVITKGEHGLKGSGRSIDAFNMIEHLRRHEDLFEKLGGHAKACGFSLKMDASEQEVLLHFREALNSDCMLTEADFEKQIWIDLQLPFKYVNDALMDELELLEPFGLMNEKPVFAQRNVEVRSSVILGKNKNLLKLQLQDEEGCFMEGLLFGTESVLQEEQSRLRANSRVRLLYYPGMNEFRGQRSPQIYIQSIQPMQ